MAESEEAFFGKAQVRAFKDTSTMSRQWVEYASPQELERITLARDIVANKGDLMTLIKAYEKRVLYWQTKRGKAILAKHRKFIKDNY